MSEITRINKIVDQLVSSLESIVQYSQFSYKDEDDNNNGDADDADDYGDDNDEYYGNSGHYNNSQNTSTKKPAFEEITNVSVNDSTQSITLVHTKAMQLITGIQELLLITRSFKERWVIGQASSFLKFTENNNKNLLQNGKSAQETDNGEMLDSLEQKTQLLSKAMGELLKK
ncbi:hypothetical protein ACO0QE_001513 [Hanseniaspora vineae]